MDTTTNRVKLNRLLHKHVPGLQFSGLKREYDDMLECATKAKNVFKKTHEIFLAESTGAKALEMKRQGLEYTAAFVEATVFHAREYKLRLGEELKLIDELLDEFDGEVIDLDSDNFECGRED